MGRVRITAMYCNTIVVWNNESSGACMLEGYLITLYFSLCFIHNSAQKFRSIWWFCCTYMPILGYESEHIEWGKSYPVLARTLLLIKVTRYVTHNIDISMLHLICKNSCIMGTHECCKYITLYLRGSYHFPVTFAAQPQIQFQNASTLLTLERFIILSQWQAVFEITKAVARRHTTSSRQVTGQFTASSQN